MLNIIINNNKPLTAPDSNERRRECEKIIDNLIKNTYKNGPAGLLHARTISKIIKRSLRIWQNGRVVHVFGRRNGKVGVDVERKSAGGSEVGHWTLKGGKNPSPKHGGKPNDCLYNVVASQTGLDSEELRRRTASEMRRNRQAVFRYIAGCENPLALVNCMLGGAAYSGRGPSDAQRVLDASQNGSCHPEGSHGHPRGHASHPTSYRHDDTVESYSMSRWRSGFLSRPDQDLVCHHALITDNAQTLMEQLNRGNTKVATHISHNELDYYPLPKAAKWSNGRMDGSPDDFQRICLVGKHFSGQQSNPSADIFVLTFYPIL